MDFVGTVLADTEDTWSQIFQQQLGQQYVPPKLVMFSGVINSGCGTAQVCNGAVLLSSRSEGVYRHRFL